MLPLWLSIVTILLATGNCAEHEQGYPSLNDHTNIKSNTLNELVEETLALKHKIEKKPGLLDNPVISNDNVDPFESSKDFYFYNSVNKDSGAAEQIWISDILPVATGIRPRRNEIFLDVDVIEMNGYKYLWLTSDSSVKMMKHSITGNRAVKGPYVTDITGAVASEAVVLLEDSIHMHRMFLFILKSLAIGKHLSWYLWDSEMERLVYKGSLEMNAMTTDIHLIKVPVTDSYMLAALQQSTVTIYMLNLKGGLLSLIFCHYLEAYGAKDLTSFSVNGQLYVAVANSYAAVSFIWKYRIQQQDFVLHQSLDMANITNLEYFWRGYEHYLAIVSRSRVDIYQWKGAQFLHLQRLSTDNSGWPIAWHSIHYHDSYPDDVVLVLVTSNRIMQFVWNKYLHQFTQIDGTDCVQWKRGGRLVGNLMSVQPNHDSEEVKDFCIKYRSNCIGTTMRDGSWYLVRNSTSANVIPGYSFYKFVQPALNCWPNNLAFPIKMVSFATNEMYQDFILASGHRVLHYLFYADLHPIPVPQSKAIPQFQYLIETMERQEKFLKRTSDLLERIMSSEQQPHHKMKSEDYHKEICPNLQERLNFLEKKMKYVNEQLSKEADDRAVNLGGLTTLKSILVTGEADIRGDAKIKFINGLDMPHFFKDAVLKNVPSRIGGTKIFLGTATIEGPLRVQHTLNGHKIPQDFVLLNKPQHIDGTWKFLAPVTVQKDVDVKYGVNGVNLASEVVPLVGSKPLHISGLKTFTSDVAVEEDVILHGRVNRVDILKMAADTWTSSGKQNITGRKVFTRVNILGKLKARLINGVNVTHLDLTTVRTNRPAVVEAPKVFAETVEIGGNGQLIVDVINGLRIPEDLVPLSDASVVVEGHKEILGRMSIAGNLNVHGRLAGVDLKDTVRTKGDQNLCGVKTFVGPTTFSHLVYTPTENLGAATVVVHGDLHINNSINGLNLQELYKDIIFKNDTEVAFTGPVIFTRPQILHGNIEITGLVNGWNLTKDFVHRSSYKNLITGHKTLKGPVIFERDVHFNNTLDGVDLNQFFSQVVKLNGPPQTIHGIKKFLGGLTVENIMDESNFSDSEISLEGWTSLKHLIVKGNVTVEGKVNGHEFSSLVNNRITLSTDQEIAGSLSLSSSSEIVNLTVLGKLNGVDIATLSKDIFWKNSEQQQLVTGEKQFTGSVISPNLHTKYGVNGVWLPDIKKRIIPIKDGILKSGTIIFEKGLTVHGPMWINGTINGVNFTTHVKDAVLKSRPQLVTGLKSFGELNVKGNVWIKGRINGFKVEDVLTLNTPQNITGRAVFESVEFKNGMNVIKPWSSKRVSFGESDLVPLTGDLTVEELWTGGDLNGIDFIQLWKNAVRRTDTNTCRITGLKHFKGNITFVGNLNVKNGINGFNYSELLGKIVTIHGDNQIITAYKEFSENIEVASSVLWSGSVKVKGLFNEVNISRLMTSNISNITHSQENAVISEDTTLSSLVVYGNVFTSSTINDIHTSDILKNSDDSVFGTKVVKKLYVKGNITATTVNGWNLTALEMDTLKVNETQYVQGTKVLAGNVTVVKDFEETSRNLGSNRRPLKLPYHQGLNSSSLVISDDFQPMMHFHGNVDFHGGLVVNGTDKQNLSVKYTSECVLSECRLLNAIQESLGKKAEMLDHFQAVQTESGAFSNAKLEIIRGSDYLVMGFADCWKPLRFYLWNSHQQSYVLNRTIHLYSIYKMVAFKHNGFDYLLIDHYSCNAGINLITLVTVPKNPKKIEVLRQSEDTILDVDVLGTEQGALIAMLHLNGRLLIQHISLLKLATVVGSSDIFLPKDAGFCSLVSAFVGGSRNYNVLVGFRNGHTRVYTLLESNLIDGIDLRLVQILSTPGATSLSTLKYGQEVTVAISVASQASNLLKMYGVMPNRRGGIFLKEIDALANVNGHETVSLDHLESNGKFYLAVGTKDALEVYVREGASSYTRKLRQAINISFLKLFHLNGRIYLVTLSNKKWQLHVSLMQGLDIPPVNIKCNPPHL